MYITQQALDIAGVTYEEYLTWCEENNKIPYKEKVRNEFFKRIFDGRIVKDSKTKRLINKHRMVYNIDEESDEEEYYYEDTETTES